MEVRARASGSSLFSSQLDFPSLPRAPPRRPQSGPRPTTLSTC